jgi:hypothetical protein
VAVRAENAMAWGGKGNRRLDNYYLVQKSPTSWHFQYKDYKIYDDYLVLPHYTTPVATASKLSGCPGKHYETDDL